MRIAFLGKGGAGKTTTSAGFVRYAAKRFPFVLAVDADVNAHLSSALQRTEGEAPVYQLGELCEEIFEYVKGRRTDLGTRALIGTTPPSLKSQFIRVSPEDPFIKKYASFDRNVGLLTVGTYKESDVGGSCYHTKLRGLASFFHHLVDSQDEIVIADTTAGTDNVATSLSFAYDMDVFVVEPTAKSVKVFRDFLDIAPHLEERVYVVANKVDGLEDEAFIYKHVPRDRVLGLIPSSRHLKRFEQGDKEALTLFDAEQEAAFDQVLDTLRSRKRNWAGYLNLLRTTHAKVCADWYNDFYGTRLDIL
jgi:CO dehydrogenase maturation factor